MRNLMINVATFSVLMFSGCATQLHNINSISVIKEGNQESIVFGRLKTPTAWLKTAYVLKIINITTAKEFEYAMRSWGCSENNDCHSQPFCFPLPPGQYKITRLDIMSGTTISSTYPDISFSVKPMTTVYIGTLSIGEVITEHNYLLWSNGKINLQVLDEHRQEQKELADTCPGVKNMHYKLGLMSSNERNAVSKKEPLDSNDLGNAPDIDYSLRNFGKSSE